jgi:antitoxin ParD1/3/4
MSLAKLNLPADLESFVQDKVERGVYQTPSEVVREALRLLRERDRIRQMRLKELKKDIALGIREADAGKLTPLDANEIKSQGRLLLKRRRRVG